VLRRLKTIFTDKLKMQRGQATNDRSDNQMSGDESNDRVGNAAELSDLKSIG
jgi:hypothetical protein